MSQCCIVQCNARKNKNQPQLTLHRVPRNEMLRKKWLDVIGIENINHRHKDWYVCSLHFEESSFNRTLDVVRLHDNAMPSPSLLTFRSTEKHAKVFSSNIARAENHRKYNLYDLLDIVPAKPLKSNDVKKYICDFTPKTDKLYIPKKKSRHKVKTVRDFRNHLNKKLVLI